MAANKNGQLFYNNLDAMVGATNPWFPKYDVRVITSAKTRPISPLDMGRTSCQWIRGTFKHSKKHGLKSVSNT